MDQETESLLDSLKTSPTDLRKLAHSVHVGERSVVGIALAAIARWERDDPKGWAAVRIMIDRG